MIYYKKMDTSLKKLAQAISDREDDKDSAEQKMSLIKVMRDSENNRLEQLAAKGVKYPDLIAFYFPGTEIANLLNGF